MKNVAFIERQLIEGISQPLEFKEYLTHYSQTQVHDALCMQLREFSQW